MHFVVAQLAGTSITPMTRSLSMPLFRELLQITIQTLYHQKLPRSAFLLQIVYMHPCQKCGLDATVLVHTWRHASGDGMENDGERRAWAYNGRLGWSPQWGPGAQPLVRGSGGKALLKPKSLSFSLSTSNVSSKLPYFLYFENAEGHDYLQCLCIIIGPDTPCRELALYRPPCICLVSAAHASWPLVYTVYRHVTYNDSKLCRSKQELS